jgi:ankyrin repeat protein
MSLSSSHVEFKSLETTIQRWSHNVEKVFKEGSHDINNFSEKEGDLAYDCYDSEVDHSDVSNDDSKSEASVESNGILLKELSFIESVIIGDNECGLQYKPIKSPMSVDLNNNIPFIPFSTEPKNPRGSFHLRLDHKKSLEYFVNDNYPNIFAAIRSGDQECTLNYVHRNDFDSKQTDIDEATPFIRACEIGPIDIVKEIFEVREVDINATDMYNRTALLLASKMGHTDIVEYLIDKNAKLTIYENGRYHGWTAYMWACFHGHEAIVKALYSLGASSVILARDLYHRDGLMLACSQGHVDVVKFLLRAGCNTEQFDEYNRNALIMASKNGHINVVDILLKNRATIENIDCCGWSALFWAVKRNHFEIVKLLLQHGADCSQRDCDGRDILMHAATNGNRAMFQYLLQKRQIFR